MLQDRWFLKEEIQSYHACLHAHSCLTPWDPMDCSLPGSSVHGDSPGKNARVGCHALLQGNFPTQGSNSGLPHCRWILYYKSLSMKVKEESEKVGLKLNIQKMKIMASNSITSWQRDGETVETVTDFILGGSKIAADGDCSHEIKRHLLLGRKDTCSYDQPRQHIKNQRHYFTNKGPSSQGYGFSCGHVWM